MTRLGDLLNFEQVLKPLATINLPKSPTLLGNFCTGVKIFNFSSEIILGNFYRLLKTFYWSHWYLLDKSLLGVMINGALEKMMKTIKDERHLFTFSDNT